MVEPGAYRSGQWFVLAQLAELVARR